MAPFVSPYARAIQQTGIQYQAAPMGVVTYQAPQQRPSVWDSYRQALLPSPEPATQVQSAVAGLRGNLESAALSSLLGVIYGKFGTLDIAGKYPIDGILAVLLYAMSVKDAGKPDGFASDLRTLSQTCTAVACFRKTSEMMRPKNENSFPDNMSGHKADSKSASHDPLVEIAKKLGYAA